MKKTIFAKTLSILLVLVMAAAWLPLGAAFGAVGDAFLTKNSPQTLPQTEPGTLPLDSGGTDDGTFVPGEVLAVADSLEDAQSIAAAYGLNLKSYAYGIAVLTTPEPEQVVVRSAMIRQNGMPKLGLNWIYNIIEDAPDFDYRNDTDSQFAATNEGYENVYERQAVPKRMTYNSEDESGYRLLSSATQWHRSEMDMDRAWGLSTGSGVVIAVIDTGIDIDHPAFAGRISEKSYNAYSNQIGKEYVRDETGHGTHVSGIIAASGVDGVYGVAPNVEVMAIKANYPGIMFYSSEHLYRAINYAAANGADVINISYGRRYDNGEDPTEKQVIANAIARGVTVVCSAGNDYDSHAAYPAAYPETIAVSATARQYQFADWFSNFSNFGPEIDISAPGSHIDSTIMGGGYGSMSGTSMAAPNVAGTAALIKALNPSYTPAQVRQTLCGTARDVGALGWDDYYGYGIVNAYAAVLGIGNPLLHDVVYNINYGNAAPVTVRVVSGNRLHEPEHPQREGYVFEGWYVVGTGEEYNFAQIVTAGFELEAKWAAIEPGMYVLEFPDANFRREVLEKINSLDNGRRKDSSYVAEDLAVLADFVQLIFSNKGIKDTTGLHYFAGLTSLYIIGNEFESVDVSALSSLELLDCSYNKLASLNVSGLSSLMYLDCSYNKFTDGGNVIGVSNTSLPAIDTDNSPSSCFRFSPQSLYDTNDITIINGMIDNNGLSWPKAAMDTSVTDKWMSENWPDVYWAHDGTSLRINSLILNSGHSSVNFSKNLKGDIDVTGLDALTSLSCEDSKISSLNVTGLTKLSWLSTWYSPIGSLDVTTNTALMGLQCVGNNLTSLDVSKNTALMQLSCFNNNLTTLDVSSNIELFEIFCRDNSLTSLDVTGLTSLVRLGCNNNDMTDDSKIIGVNTTLLPPIDTDSRRPSSCYTFSPQNVFYVINNVNYNIPSDIPGTPVSAIDVSGCTDGMTGPYSYEMTSGPYWLKIDRRTGIITGTRPTSPQPMTTAIITVTDKTSAKAHLTIKVGNVTNIAALNTYFTGQYPDVDEDAWYGVNRQKTVVRAFEYGLMQGNDDGRFNPLGSVTLAEAITIAARVHSIYNGGDGKFEQGEPWYQVYVDYAI